MPQDNVLIGSDFTTSVVIANGGKRERTVIGQLSCHSVSYTGVRVHIIKAVKVQATIAPGRGKCLEDKIRSIHNGLEIIIQ